MTTHSVPPKAPNGLRAYSWYLPHQAYLKSIGYSRRHDDEGATPKQLDMPNAYLRHADLRNACLHKAQLIGADLSYARLNDSDLSDSNLSDSDLCSATLHNAYLSRSNLSGSNFNSASFYASTMEEVDLSGASLHAASLRDAFLRLADLSYTDLQQCDLSGADLCLANLIATDLSGPEIPVVPDIDKAVFAAVSKEGNDLIMTSWHKCETTHCRAGWAIHLAGDAGRALEDKLGPCAAGALIYAKSRPNARVPNFYEPSFLAMADIKACAEEGA
jgi:uncharacterized protein YjbI with pentapeptide repeats